MRMLDIITFVLAVVFGLNLLISKKYGETTNKELINATAFLACMIVLFS